MTKNNPNPITRRLLALAAILAVLPGLAQARPEKLTLTGSSTLAPLVTKLAKRFMAANPGVVIAVEAGGSLRGAADALSGKADIGMVSRRSMSARASPATPRSRS